MEEPRPPYLLCALILGATLAGCVALLYWREDRSRETTAAVSAMTRDLAQVIELKQVYSKPVDDEDPSRYPKLDAEAAAPRGQKSPSDSPGKPLRSL
jgi:hypothetical protein